MEGAEEETCCHGRVVDAHHPGGVGPPEVVLHHPDAAPWRGVLLAGIERHHQGGLRRAVHVHRHLHGDHLLHEGDELQGEAAQDDARIGGGVDGSQRQQRLRQLDAPAAHRFGEEGLLRIDVAEEGGRGDPQLAGDVGQGGPLEAFLAEDAAGGGQKLVAVDGRAASHL
jgi:hypothetical protein